MLKEAQGSREVRCAECGRELSIGDWPMCPHGSVIPDVASRVFTVVFRDPRTGEVHVPGNQGDPVPRGLERVEIRSSREWAAVEKGMNARTREEAQRVFARDREGFGEVRREMHADLRNRAKYFGAKGREFADYALERSREKEASRRAKDSGGMFAARHWTEGHIREQIDQRRHEASRGRK